MKLKMIGWALPMALPLLFLPSVVAQQAPGNGTVSFEDPLGGQAQVEAYWTPSMMASAVPMTPPPQLVENLSADAMGARMDYATPGLVNGWVPGSGPYIEQRMEFPRAASLPALLKAPQTFGTAPTNPQDGPYGPFQRHSMHGTYLPFPRGIHGKLFFSIGASNFVCSGTVIGRSTVATAGHCVSNGNSTFATNLLFCPGYNQGGINPSRGCWGGTQVTSTRWHVNGDPDYDYACIITNTTGTSQANKIGNLTGWAGRAWNWVDVPESTFGYPQAAPFNGLSIQQTSSVDWYTVDFTAGDQVSKIIGSDLTGGSSGGGWFLSWRSPGEERADTDGSNATDPAGAANGPFINGVNSHKRCRTTCANPPSTTAGVFWQEMTSPPFRSTAPDGGESEDVFAVCLADVNNNASAPASSAPASVPTTSASTRR